MVDDVCPWVGAFAVSIGCLKIQMCSPTASGITSSIFGQLMYSECKRSVRFRNLWSKVCISMLLCGQLFTSRHLRVVAEGNLDLCGDRRVIRITEPNTPWNVFRTRLWKSLITEPKVKPQSYYKETFAAAWRWFLRYSSFSLIEAE